MPHFGLMDEDALGPEAAALMRAQLHLRAGKRRLKQDKTEAGIAALYDALLSALRWYAASPARMRGIAEWKAGGYEDEGELYRELTRSGVLDGSFDFDSFKSLAEGALEGAGMSFDPEETLVQIERVMIRLGVMPFDEDALPPERPDSF